MRRILLAALCPVSLLLTTSDRAAAEDWPAFRGPTGLGVSTEADVPTEWGPKQNVKWTTPLPGPANSSPIVVAGRVLLTTAVEKGAKRTLHCFDRATGKEQWARTVEAKPGIETHDTNPYSGSTPVSDGQRVVVWHGTPGLFCYDLEGKLLWEKDLGPVKHIWGYGSSPVIVDGRVLVNFGPGENSALLAVSLEDGDVLWRNDFPGAFDRNPGGGYVGSWSTPVVTEIGGKTVAITSLPTRVVAVDPTDGTELWSVDGLKHDGANHELAYTSVVLADGVGVAMGGFKGPAIGFKLDGTGDDDQRRLWREGGGNPQRIGSGVVVDGHLYMANAGPGTVQCLEPATGKVLWRDRLQGGNAWGSLVLAGGNLYVTCQDGTTNVFRPNPEKFDPIATNKLPGKCNSTPAISDGELFIRTYEALYCIGE